jgi:DNA replication initiation complex subunit (GINS family)
MSYDILYQAWLREKENLELQKLPKGFYAETAEYIRHIRREGRMLESKSVKAKLISQELSKAKRMIRELIALRFDKLVKQAKLEEPLSREALTSEEEGILLELKPSFEKFHEMLKDSTRGKPPESGEKVVQARKLVRFLKEVPAIVGADLKIYGPFAAEDVATLPAENARVLAKHGAAMEIETK